jgi:hypothetical protein
MAPRRELEPWGGEVHVPRWLRRLLRRPEPLEDTSEKGEEWQPGPDARTPAENINHAAAGPLIDLYREDRSHGKVRSRGRRR